MITALHNLVYSDDAPATRQFFRDVLQSPLVTEDDSSAGHFLHLLRLRDQRNPSSVTPSAQRGNGASEDAL